MDLQKATDGDVEIDVIRVLGAKELEIVALRQRIVVLNDRVVQLEATLVATLEEEVDLGHTDDRSTL